MKKAATSAGGILIFLGAIALYYYYWVETHTFPDGGNPLPMRWVLTAGIVAVLAGIGLLVVGSWVRVTGKPLVPRSQVEIKAVWTGKEDDDTGGSPRDLS